MTRKKAEARAHILEGLRIALDHIDEIISIIRGSQTGDAAKQAMMERFGLSDRQSQAILDMRMVRLTGLEREKIEGEYQDLLATIEDLKDILARPERVHEIIATELEEIAEKHGDDRRTELLIGEALSIEDEDLIEEEEIVVTLSHNGYMKRMAISEFKAQNRGGRGVKGMGTNTDDFVETLLTCSTHDLLLFFTNTGKVYKAKGYEVPEYGRTAKGIPAINFLGIENDEKIQAIINTRGETDEKDQLFFTTRQGTVKRTAFSDFENIRTSGLKAIVLKDDDELINVLVTHGDDHIIIGTRQGYAVSFHEDEVRSMGRAASGVRGIRLREDDYVVGTDILGPESEVLVITENGYGKRTEASEYAIRGRGGKGVKTANITEKNGPLIGLKTVSGEEDIMLITTSGVVIRFHAKNISKTGRATQGVRLMRLEEGNYVSTLAKVEVEDEIEVDEPLNEEDNGEEVSDQESSEES